MTTHTPGPWYTNGTMVEQDTGSDPCYPIAGLETDVPEWQANARLIAAAPELLEVAIRYAMRECETRDGVNTTGACGPCAARAAIAKARGE